MSRFAVDTSSFSNKAPLLPAGFYAGKLINVSTHINGNSTIEIVEKKEYPKNGPKEGVGTGQFILRGTITFGVALTSKKAIQILHRDEPKIFGGQIRLNFDEETFKFKENYTLKSWLDVLGLGTMDFNELVDWEEDENINIPENISHLPYAYEAVTAQSYYQAYFDIICQTALGLDVKASIKVRKNQKTSLEENVIECGTTFTPFCGIIAYVKDAEEDLENNNN